MTLKCESRVESSLYAETFTGPTRNEVVCEIGTRRDLHHFVIVRNLRIYPIEVVVSVQITSDASYIRFEPRQGHPEVQVSDDSWAVACLLDNNQEFTFLVGLVSTLANGTDQGIEINLEIDRWHRMADFVSMSIVVSS